VAFLNDSIVLVANPSLNTVTPINVLRGSAGDDIPVGRFPQSVVALDGRAYVLNSELDAFVPDGPATISVVDAASLTVTSTIILSGENAAAGVVGPDGLLFVLHSGSFGAGNGSLSVVDLATLAEVEHHEGFGEFPGALAVGPSGDLFVGAFSYGVVIWSPALDAFVRGLGDAITPGGVASTSGLGFDEDGGLYTLTPDCQEPATANRHDGTYAVELTIAVGICPFAISFGSVEEGN
jgi:DNA-binding beta-propeller fold protein YncE